MLPVHQRNILAKLRLYLSLMNRDPEFVENFQGGYCLGISSLWLYCKWLSTQPKIPDEPRDDYLWFDKTVRSIVMWDGKLSSLTEKEPETILGEDYALSSIDDFERFISLIQLFHLPFMYLSVAQGDNWSRFPGYLSSFGGQIEANETPLQAIIRELNEELGAKAQETEISFLGALTEDITNHSELIHIYFWRDLQGTITGCYEGDIKYFNSPQEIIEQPKVMDSTLWALKECIVKKFL